MGGDAVPTKFRSASSRNGRNLFDIDARGSLLFPLSSFVLPVMCSTIIFVNGKVMNDRLVALTCLIPSALLARSTSSAVHLIQTAVKVACVR